MSAPSFNVVIAALMTLWKSTSAITTITGTRIYQAWPQTQTEFPVMVLWDGVDVPKPFDQGNVTAHDVAAPLEIAGYSPNQLRDLQAAIEDVTNTAALAPAGYLDVFCRLGPWIPKFDASGDGKKMFRRISTLRIHAQPA